MSRTQRYQSNPRLEHGSATDDLGSPSSSPMQESGPALPLCCINPEERKLLVEARPPYRPRFVYHLWVSRQRQGKSTLSTKLWRTYSYHSLALHDAVCLIVQQHAKRGYELDAMVNDAEYAAQHEGRCYRLGTHPKLYDELGVRWWAWTTEERLF